MVGLVGFRHDAQTTLTDASLSQSRSGLYVDALNRELMTTSNLKSAVTVAGTTLTDYIKQTLNDSVADVLVAIRTRKLARLESRSILANTPLYEGEGSLSQVISTAGRFVGLSLETANLQNIALSVTRIGLQFTEPVDVPLYVFADGELIDTLDLPYTKTGRMEWVDLTGIVLMPGRRYWIGYYEADLGTARAIRRSRTIDVSICTGCSPVNAEYRRRWKPFVSVDAVRVDTVQLVDGIVTPDSVATTITEQNWGLNLVLSATCDITDLVIDQQTLLAPAIQQAAYVKLLSSIAYSSRTTTIEQTLRDKAMFALKNGAEQTLSDLLDAADVELSNIDPRCLPPKGDDDRPRKTTLFSFR